MCSVIFTTKETWDERDLIERASRLELETGIFIVFPCSFETYGAHLIAVAVYLTGCRTESLCSQIRKVFQRSHHAVIRVYDEAGNVIETHEHKGEVKEP
jgi:hypothetical protein